MSTGQPEMSINLPQLQKWSIKRFYDYEAQVVDYEKLEELNEALMRARRGLFEVTEYINKVEREERNAQILYDRMHRREYFKSSEKTDTGRKAQADLICENYENDAIKFNQIKIELIRTSNTLRQELQTLQTVANNLRQQMKMES